MKAIGGDSSVRENFRTAFYVGGDLRSASALLDMPQREIDEGGIVTGLAYLRSVATSPATMVRVPYASNQAVAGLLGGGDVQSVADNVTRPSTGPDTRVIPFPGPVMARSWPGGEGVQAGASGRLTTPQDTDSARILTALAAGRSVKEIAADLSGTDNPGSRAHKEAREKIERLMGGLAAQAMGGH